MTLTDHAMLALGVLSLSVFAFAGGFALMVMIDEIIPNFERITAALFPVNNAASADISPAGSPLDAVMGVSQYRAVTIAPGHTLNVRKLPKQPDRPGFIRVEARHRQPFDIRTSLWNEAPIV